MTITSTPFEVEPFFDGATHTFSYLLVDPATNEAAIVDSVLDFDAASCRTGTVSAERIAARVEALGAKVRWLLETHVHADHLSAAPWLRERVGGRIAIGARIARVQRALAGLFDAGPGEPCDGREFDRLFADGECFALGRLALQALHTPGHTPACTSYVVRSGGACAAFVGDTLFMPDYGTARCDFPGGDAATLYRSIARLLALAPRTRLFTAHDYPPAGREARCETTVAEQRAHNVHVRDGVGEAEFVALREARDATLKMPALMLPSVQVNLRAGRLPEPAANGIRYLRIPLDAL